MTQRAREMLDDLAEWCAFERAKLGAVDGYDYHSGEEFGIRTVEIEIRKLAERLAAQADAPGGLDAATVEAPELTPADKRALQIIRLATEQADHIRALESGKTL